MSRTGRRPGDSGARASILDAARESFASKGFDGATIRGIAAAAGVDPALVHHYFGTKAELFQAAIRLPVDPAVAIPSLLAGDPATLGERVLRLFFGIWEAPEGRRVMIGVLRSAVSNEAAAVALRAFITREVLGPLTRALGVPNADLRATLVGSQVVGLALVRYILKVDPLASADRDAVVAAVAPTIQRYLLGDIGP